MKLTNAQAYQALTEAGAQWDRKDASHIIVWTSGYVNHQAHELEELLMQAGMRLVEQEFDRVCGKTRNVFRHKEAV